MVVAGLVIAIRTMNSRRGERIAFMTLDDRSGRIEIAVFSEAYQKYRDLLVKLYGEEKGRAVKYAETFEVCEYGRRPSAAEIKQLFPFYEAK